MKKEEFLRQLEYLLQDVPDEEKRDAIAYYRDYLEDAGPENEEAVLEGLGSPEKIASEIRTDLLGGMKQGGEFTDRGYTDERFERISHPAVPEPQAEYEEDGSGNRAGDGTRFEKEKINRDGNADGRKTGKIKAFFSGPAEDVWWKYLLAGVVIVIAAPVLLSALLGLAGSMAGIVGLLVGCLILLAVLTLTAFIGGAALLASGFLHLFTGFWSGLMMVGLGMLAIGGGLLLFFCSYMFYGKFLPWACRGIWGACRKAAASLSGQGR